MNKIPFFNIKQTCNKKNEDKIYRFWSYDSRYSIKDYYTKIIFIFALIIGIACLTFLACRSFKDIVYELKNISLKY